MARPVREDIRQQTIEEIKTVARRQMGQSGTGGLSLRAIAREMEITAPAIYNYFASLDDLITALIVDGFAGLAEALEQVGIATSRATPVARLRAVMLEYRQWAIDHAVEFQLIYGNPIPGYVAPAQITVPLVQRGFVALAYPLVEAWDAGLVRLPPMYEQMPATVLPAIRQIREQFAPPYPDGLIYALIVGWTRIHGMITLELFGHTPPTVGDAEAFYRHEVEGFIRQLIVDS
jgi:AcrR family transcriptional regulator